MGEIFIPEKIFDKIQINNISDNLINLFQNNFEILETKEFKSTYCIGTYIKFGKLNQDILSILNGEFGDTYFVDYNFLESDLESTGTKILKPEHITENILEISNKFEMIVNELSSTKLLTFSKKKDINKKIEKTFFTISGILFLLYFLKEKSQENYKELDGYNGLVEYEAQAEIISHSAKTKGIELSAQIDKFEAKSELFFQTIEKIFL